jgi:ATP-dependent RNA helicase DDX24/MAK5
MNNFYEPYTTNPSRNLRLFNPKLSLLPYEGEMLWALQKRCVPAPTKFPQTPTLAQGSGKTLAYGLPILHKLLSQRKYPASKTRRPVRALILAPTRELALQISSHLNACLNDPHAPEERPAPNNPKAPKLPPLVSVAAIVGGMSLHKQKRILSRGVDVLVATPGRLWDMMQEVCNIQHPVDIF